jgi:peptide-methionine (S)-S-oxide reductase
MFSRSPKPALVLPLTFVTAIACFAGALHWLYAGHSPNMTRMPIIMKTTDQIGAELDPSGRTRVMEKATFGAGCFWGVEAAFRQIKGVASTSVGYTGGNLPNATYEDVCSGRTGHAEAVEVQFDPTQVSYNELLQVFWENHDPTQLNRQGPDFGTQYRSAIFFHSPEQEAAARASKQQLEASGKLKRPIATQVVAAGEFYRAEDYHQQYLEKRGLASCHIR